MRIYACLIGILIALTPIITEARIIAGNTANAICVYYFSEHEHGIVEDQSGNDLDGVMFGNTHIWTIGSRQGLRFWGEADYFNAWNDNRGIQINREFTIVALVRLSTEQGNDFVISLFAYGGRHPLLPQPPNFLTFSIRRAFAYNRKHPFLDFPQSVIRDAAHLIVKPDGTLRGEYDDGVNEVFSVNTERRVIHREDWHHLALTVNNDFMVLYLNGSEVAHEPISGHLPLVGDGRGVIAGYGARGSVDDIAMFREVFSSDHIRLVYKVGLENVMSIASIDPNAKIATTWGALKSR